MKVGRIVVALALGAAACADDAAPGAAPPPSAPLVCEAGSTPVDDRCVPAGFEECPDGVGKDGAPCGEAAGTCAPGTVAFFAQTTCTAVGPGECPSGFARDASGFGCSPVLPAAACTGATRPRLGETSCVPVGDCDAPFPPSGATHFVDDSYSGGQIDATHFATIQAAVAAAPAGAVIAIAEGTYAGTVTLSKPVTLVGRCAERVTLSGVGAAAPGLEVADDVATTVRGLTVTDFEVGVSAAGGADVTIEALVLEANRRGGIMGADAGTRVRAKGVVVRGSLPDASSRFGHGVASGFDADVTIEDSAVLASSEIGAGAQRNGRVTVVRSVVSGVTQRASNRAYGWGIGTQTGGQATVVESAIQDTFAGGIVAAGDASSVRLERSFVSGVRNGPTTGGGAVAAAVLTQGEGASVEVIGSTLTASAKHGVFVGDGAKATISTTVVRDLEGSAIDGAGVQVSSTSRATVSATAVIGTTVSGILSAGELEANDVYLADVSGAGLAVRGTAKVSRFVVADLRAGKGEEGSAFSAALYVDAKGALDASEVSIRKAYGLGAFATGSGTTLTLRRAAISDTQAADESSGFGVTVAKGAEATIEDAVVSKANDIAVHVLDVGTVATLRRVTVVDTQPNTREERGRSLNVQDGASLHLVGVLARGGTQVGLDVVGEGAVASVENSVLAGVTSTVNGFGHGVAVTQGGALVMVRSIVRDHAGVGLVFANASGSVAGSVIRANPVGVHTQDGVSLVEVSAAPAEVAPLSVAFTTDTRFEDNGTKVGSGEIPLPVQAAAPR